MVTAAFLPVLAVHVVTFLLLTTVSVNLPPVSVSAVTIVAATVSILISKGSAGVVVHAAWLPAPPTAVLGLVTANLGVLPTLSLVQLHHCVTPLVAIV